MGWRRKINVVFSVGLAVGRAIISAGTNTVFPSYRLPERLGLKQ